MISTRIKLGLLKRFQCLFNDEQYIKLQFRIKMGRPLDLDNCRTMNEKLNWLKLNNRYALLTDLVDKVKVKEHIARKIGDQYIVPTLKVWNSPEDITQEEIRNLPDRFVIKVNHCGGNNGIAIVRDKRLLDLSAVRKSMYAAFKKSVYKSYREWPYKNIDKKILAEEYLGENPTDYKFYCFNGKVDCVLLCIDRQTEGPTKFYFFNQEWELCRYNKRGKEAPEGFTLPKPEGMDEMFRLAAELSEGFPMVRVDMYNINGKIYFGEMTFYPDSGLDANRLPEADLYFGNQIDCSIARNEDS